MYIHVIVGDGGLFERCTTNMVDLGTYEFDILDEGKITPIESFQIEYVE